MSSLGSNISASKDAPVGIDGAKNNPNEECANETKTVKTMDYSQSAGQFQHVKPVEIVHEILAKEDPNAKKK